ncbi:hypothetical protein FACS1894110_25040 [Spirochaetia bacterium]|nr:hypothetical protein FACS1894110_25040 [Spirochaetia bacterium]
MGKKKSILNRIGAIVGICLLVLVLLFAVLFEVTGDRVTKKPTADYSHAVSLIEGITEANPRIIDLALLASHDSFSNRIKWSSADDPWEVAKGAFQTKPGLRQLFWGISRRFTRAQNLDAYDQLRAGARYIDVRISWHEGDYYTKHGFISAPFKIQLEQMLQFLAENPGEVVVLNFHQLNLLSQKTFVEFLNYVDGVKFEGRSLFDYIPYKTAGEGAAEVWELRYNTLTDRGAKSGIVMLFCSDETPDAAASAEGLANKIYSYYDETDPVNADRSDYTAIRMLWHESNSSDEIFKGIINEEAYIKANWDKYSKMFRVNQTQKTKKLGGAGEIFRTSVGWSLLDFAEDFNYKLPDQKGFAERFAVMPIFQVDFINASKGDFNNRINAAIRAYNNSMCNAAKFF